MGQVLAYEKHCKFRFGSYVESHEDRKITNNMEEQTISKYLPGDHWKVLGELYNILLKDRERGYMQAENTRNPNDNLGHPRCWFTWRA